MEGDGVSRGNEYGATRSAGVGDPRVAGGCPSGCGETLVLNPDGWVQCADDDCPDPMGPAVLLAGPWGADGPLGVGVLRARLEAAEFALSRVRALVAEHPADAVPVLELAAVARAAGVEMGG